MPLTHKELAKYKEALIDLRSTLQAEINQEHGEANIVKLEGTMGRVSRGDALQVQQLALNVKRQREQRLTRVQTALERINKNEFGQCVRCDNPIARPRLDAFPDALLCVKCAESPRQ